jgi:expansin
MYAHGFLLVGAVASAAMAAPELGGVPVHGESSHYGGNLNGGMCSFSTYTLPEGTHGVAFSGQAWEDSGVCGACVEVTGPSGNTIKAMVSTLLCCAGLGVE